MNNPFFVDLNNGLKKVVEAKGDRLVTLDSQFTSLKQKNDISDLLQQKPAAIFINPVKWEGIKGTLIEAKLKKVPVIIVEAPVSGPDLLQRWGSQPPYGATNGTKSYGDIVRYQGSSDENYLPLMPPGWVWTP